MKRRSFLAMLGLAPVAGTAVAASATAPADATASANFRMTTSAGPSGHDTRICMEVREIRKDVDEQQEWIATGFRELIDDARAIADRSL